LLTDLLVLCKLAAPGDSPLAPTFNPERARAHPVPVAAGQLSRHADFWRLVAIPNANLSSQEAALVTRAVTVGVSHLDFVDDGAAAPPPSGRLNYVHLGCT
jgi:hypothetical protein